MKTCKTKRKNTWISINKVTVSKKINKQKHTTAVITWNVVARTTNSTTVYYLNRKKETYKNKIPKLATMLENQQNLKSWEAKTAEDGVPSAPCRRRKHGRETKELVTLTYPTSLPPSGTWLSYNKKENQQTL